MVSNSHIRIKTTLIAFCAVISATCLADSWNLPEVATYTSDDGLWRLTVTPRELSNQLAYFEDKVAGKDKAGERSGGNEKARGLLQKRAEQHWVNVWDKALVNDVAPVEVLVSSSGRIAALDNWHATGYGDSTVVVYDMAGLPVCSLGLYDLLPAIVVDNLPHSVSSIQWRTDARYSDNGQVLLLTIATSNGFSNQQDLTDNKEQDLKLSLRMKDCSVVPPSKDVWHAVLAMAQKRQWAADKEHEDWRAKFLAPLSAPTDDNPQAWKNYLSSAWSRTTARDSGVYPRVQVLTPEGRPKYESSLEDLKKELRLLGQWSEVLVVGSASPKSLVTAIEQFSAGASPDSLRSKQIVLALPSAYFEAARKTLVPTGANIVQIDPTVPISQSDEYLNWLTQGEQEKAKEIAARARRARWWQDY